MKQVMTFMADLSRIAAGVASFCIRARVQVFIIRYSLPHKLLAGCQIMSSGAGGAYVFGVVCAKSLVLFRAKQRITQYTCLPA